MVKIISDSPCDLSPELLELRFMHGQMQIRQLLKHLPRLLQMLWNFFVPMWKLEERLSAFLFHQGCPRQEM